MAAALISRVGVNIVIIVVVVGLAVCLVLFGRTSSVRPPILQSPNTAGPPTAPAAQILRVADVKAYVDKPRKHTVIVDLQEREKFAKAHIPSSINIPSDEMEVRAYDELDKTDQIILVGCACDGTNSDSLLRRSALIKHGFQNMVILDGGIQAWKNAKLPTVAGSQNEASLIEKSDR